jgi:hypothetical protein
MTCTAEDFHTTSIVKYHSIHGADFTVRVMTSHLAECMRDIESLGGTVIDAYTER